MKRYLAPAALALVGLTGCRVPPAEIQTPAGGVRVGGYPFFTAEVLDFQGNELFGFETIVQSGCIYVDVINAKAPELITNVLTKCTP